MKRTSTVLASLSLALACAGAFGATLHVNYLDGPGEGFNDPGTPHAGSTADGNPGATLGAQRRWAFEKGMEFWALRLQSPVTIEVDAQMNDLACDASNVILGSAGPIQIYRFPPPGGSPHPVSDTWYAEALTNRFQGSDADTNFSDIEAFFNKKIDESTSCLGSSVWYYALGDSPPGTVSFFKTVLHEIGHGVGFLTFVDIATGEKLAGFNDTYMLNLIDHSLGQTWPNLSNAQRQASAIDTNDLHWVGPNVTANSGSLSSGFTGTHVHMYAPNPLEPGSSVSHWDADVNDLSGNSELMEPSATNTEKLTVTDELLHDIGWNDVAANNCAFAQDRQTVTTALSGTINHNACVSVTYDGAVVNSGSTSALAGQQIILQGGFTVKIGATFAADIDPAIGL